jgi:hypothetical protein
MDIIDETIHEIRQLPSEVIDSEMRSIINNQLEIVKTKIFNKLNEHNENLKTKLDEQAKLQAKQDYINSLKKDIFTMLTTHIPIGSNIYPNYDVDEETTLSSAQQIALYETVFEQLNDMLKEAKHQKMNNDLISELALAIYTWGSSKLSVVSSQLEDVSKKSLELSSKTIAVVASIEFLYNYLPDGTRSSLEGIPYVGSMFKIANHIQPVVIGVQNTAAVSASIYMALKSGGIDPQPFINNVLSSCQRTGQTIGQRMMTTVSGFCSRILDMFQVNFDDTIVIYFTPSPEQIPLLSYASYNQSQIMLNNPEQSALGIANDLDLLITQLNQKLTETQEVEQLEQLTFSQPSPQSFSSSNDDRYGTRKRGRSDEYDDPSKKLRFDNDVETLIGGRRRTKKRRSSKRRSSKRGGYRKRKHTNRRRHKKSKRHHRR